MKNKNKKTNKNNKVTTPVYKGTKNRTNFPEFVALCKLSQKDLKDVLFKELENAGYTDIVSADGFVYAKGDLPYLLTAHMDTVHKERIKDFYEYVDDNGMHVLYSPQGIGGDDRCGIYMILEIIKEYKPSILFCEDEEIGGVGSKKFCKTEYINDLADLKFLVELDRAYGNDAVFYDCDNPEFTKFIEETTGYKEAMGSFTDISFLAPACKVAAVNFSCGYYHAHTTQEEVKVEEMFKTIEVVKKLLTTDCKQFEYIESDYAFDDAFSLRYRYGYGYGYNYGYNYSGYSKTTKTSLDDKYDDEDDMIVYLYVMYIDSKGREKDAYSEGMTEAEAWVNFFFDNPDVCYNQVLDYDVDCY